MYVCMYRALLNVIYITYMYIYIYIYISRRNKNTKMEKSSRDLPLQSQTNNASNSSLKYGIVLTFIKLLFDGNANMYN